MGALVDNNIDQAIESLTVIGAEGQYYIETLEHNRSKGLIRMWWAKNNQGYTYCVAKAGRYSRQEADKIVSNSNGSERMWPVKDVLEGKTGRRILAIRMDE